VAVALAVAVAVAVVVVVIVGGGSSSVSSSGSGSGGRSGGGGGGGSSSSSSKKKKKTECRVILLNPQNRYQTTLFVPPRGYSRFQVTGMIKGFFWVGNFLFQEFFGQKNFSTVA